MGFWPESGTESPGWSENPDQILAGIQNGVGQLEQKPGCNENNTNYIKKERS